MFRYLMLTAAFVLQGFGSSAFADVPEDCWGSDSEGRMTRIGAFSVTFVLSDYSDSEIEQLVMATREETLAPLMYSSAPDLTRDTNPPAYSLRLKMSLHECSDKEAANVKIRALMALKGAIVKCELLPILH